MNNGKAAYRPIFEKQLTEIMPDEICSTTNNAKALCRITLQSTTPGGKTARDEFGSIQTQPATVQHNNIIGAEASEIIMAYASAGS